MTNGTETEPLNLCNQASSVLFLFLMLGTVWLGVSIFNFKKTFVFIILIFLIQIFINYAISRPFLSAGKREALSDYALPIAVVTMSFVGSYLFQDVKSKHP